MRILNGAFQIPYFRASWGISHLYQRFTIYANKQVPKYVSWYSEPASWAVHARKWLGLQFYLFSPFSLIGVSISKLIEKIILGIMVIPHWLTQNWILLLTQCLVDSPLEIPTTTQYLILPTDQNCRHPLDILNFTTQQNFETFSFTKANSAIFNHKYKENEKVCIINCLRFYKLKRDQRMDNTKGRLIITYGKPNHHLSDDTLSRWVKEELQLTDLDMNTFTTNSCRSASASKARQVGISLNDILKTGCWLKENTFKKFIVRTLLTWTIKKWATRTNVYQHHVFRRSSTYLWNKEVYLLHFGLEIVLHFGLEITLLWSF